MPVIPEANVTDQPAWYQRFLKLEPAVLRGFLVALSAVLALVLGKTVFDQTAIDTILELYSSVSALVAAFLIRPAVTANAKVVVYDDTPLETTPTLVPGEAVVTIPNGSPVADQVLTAAMDGPRHRAAA